MYTIKEIFTTLQGEGTHAGRASVFCRFTGCNLWSGLEKDRLEAICQFCDTDFVGYDGIGGGKFNSASELANTINEKWALMNKSVSNKYVVFTGGEPLLQLDTSLINALKLYQFEIAIETNGTIIPPPGIDWICVSPKDGSKLLLLQGDEIKYVVPQKQFSLNKTDIVKRLKRFEQMNFKHFYLQAMDSVNLKENLSLAITICKERPIWRLSTQQHKSLNLP
jgi:7-carboxy-7-deazaguanine synthase (Cx14CxxC type)